MRSLRSGAGKLHWYQSDASRRLDLAKAIGTLDVTHTAVVGHGRRLTTERARRKCMEALLPDLEHSGVDTVTLESRQQRNNRHDIDMVDACRRKKIISQGFHVTFALGMSEPLLWLPDASCGSVLADQRGDSTFMKQLGGTLRMLSIAAH